VFHPRFTARVLFVTLLLGVPGFRPPTVQAATWVFLSLASEKRIDSYRLDEATGTLALVARNVVDAGEPGALAISDDRRWMLAAIRSTGRLASFKVDTAHGTLTPVSVVDAGADPAHISLDRTNRYLLAAYYVAGKVSVHRIQTDGTLSAQPVQELPTADKAHAIVPDRTNRFVYVPHTGSNVIFQFKFDPARGLLAPLMPDRKSTPAGTGPRHLAWHPDQPIAYVDNEQGSSVTPWRMNSETGDLSPGETVSTIPADFRETNSCAEIRIDRRGRLLFVANRGHNSIASFRIDASGTVLRPAGHGATEPVPRSFDLDPSGRYLFAAGEVTGKLATFRIDRDSGALDRIATQEVGARPWWVMVVGD